MNYSVFLPYPSGHFGRLCGASRESLIQNGLLLLSSVDDLVGHEQACVMLSKGFLLCGLSSVVDVWRDGLERVYWSTRQVPAVNCFPPLCSFVGYVRCEVISRAPCRAIEVAI